MSLAEETLSPTLYHAPENKSQEWRLKNKLFLMINIRTMKYKKQISRFLVLMLLIPLAGCIKSGDFDFDKMKDIEWNPNMAIPLVSSDLTIMDMIKEVDSSYFDIDNQGFVTLVYRNKLFSVNPSSSFKIPQISFDYSHTFNATEAIIINNTGTLSIPFQQDIKLTPADSIRIDSLIYGKGNITLTMSGTALPNNGSITFNIPQARKNGVPLNATFTPLNNGIKTIDLSGYNFDLTKVAGQPSTIRLNGTVTISNLPAGSISAGKNIGFNFEQNTESVKVLSGYLGRFILISDKTTTEINLFNNSMSIGNFKLVNPYFIFTFHNSIGVPVDLRFTEITGKNNATGQTLNIIPNQGIPDPFSVGIPLYSDVDPVKVTTVRIDNLGTNGAISSLVDLLKPGKLVYGFSSLTNPYGEQSENFLRDSGKLDLDVEFGMPLYGMVKDFAVQDTFDFKFDKIDEAESLLLRTIISNEFPIDAVMQVYFTDENFVRLDSLVTGTDRIIIPAATVNFNTGELISATNKISDFSYSKARINKIVNAKNMLIKAVLNTSESGTQNVKIYDTYNLKVKIAAQVEIKKKL